MRLLQHLFLAFLALSLSPADGSALALSPSLILLRDVPLGRSGSLQEVAKVSYQLSNTSDADAVYSVRVAIPEFYAFDEFEKGYEGAPDASWFRLDREVVPPRLVPAGVDHA